jgi:hypothetical protein
MQVVNYDVNTKKIKKFFIYGLIFMWMERQNVFIMCLGPAGKAHIRLCKQHLVTVDVMCYRKLEQVSF